MLVDEIYDQGQSLAQALGNLRYRLEAAFSRNGMDLVWDLQELDALEQMGGREAHEVLRIVQEAICNAMRHAQASTITVRTNLRPESGTLTIDVRDDGRGFTQRRGQPGGRGLLGMRERAAALGGSLQVFSAPGSGTCVRINLPVQVPQIS
jgi:signal transduction histidine kinase